MTDMPPAEMPAPAPPIDQPQAGRGRKAALAFILVTVLLDMLALGIIIPVLPLLVESFVGSASAAGMWVGIFATLWAATQFIASPVQGALSDHFGRRPVILLSNVGLGLDYVLMALAPTLGWLLLGRVLSGASAASISTAFAYIADITAPDKRAARFGLLGAAFGLAFVVGPAFGGFLGAIDPRLPFWAAAGMSLVNAAYGYFILPESLPVEKRSAFSWKRANPLGSLRLLRSHHDLFGLATVNFLSQFAHFALQTTFVLYAAHRYSWDPGQVGLSLAGIGLCAAVVQGGLTGITVKRLGERKTIALALVCGGVGFAIYGFAPTGWIFLIGIPIMSLWGMTGPATQSLMSRRVSVSEQGQLQGAVMGLSSLAGITAPLLFGGLYSAFNGPLAGWGQPGAPFLAGAVVLFSAAMLSWQVAKSSGRREAAAANSRPPAPEPPDLRPI